MADDKKEFVKDKVVEKVESIIKDRFSEQTDSSSKNGDNIQKVNQDLLALQTINDELSAKLSLALKANENLEKKLQLKDEEELIWANKYRELEKKIQILEKENEKFYSVDKFEGYNEF